MMHRSGWRSVECSLNGRRGWPVVLRSGMSLAVLAVSFFAVAAPVWAGGVATEAIRGTVNEVIRLLEDKDLKKPDRREERRKLLEKAIGERFSYEEMAKRSLAAQWPKLNEGQKQEFVGLFQALLARTYADKIENYSGEPVQYVNERNQEGYAEVRTKVISGKAEIPLDYRLMTKAGDWRVYDVVVDGISLVNNYRGQFTKIINSPGGYPELVETLRKKSEKIPAP